MDQDAMNVKHIEVCNDQAFEWGTVESKFAKIKKYTCIDYYFSGSIWAKVLKSMKDLNMKSSAISYYKGAKIDELTKTVTLRGDFLREIVSDKHNYFWRLFFKCSKDEKPNFITGGKIIKLPHVSADNKDGNDKLSFYVNGTNVNEMLQENDSVDESSTNKFKDGDL